ncbi:MAG: hypothetical protein IJH11_05210 [Lachnospiraceae bacterium]|nr:hypothetical protein [Lachnospiraceae bacterium]
MYAQDERFCGLTGQRVRARLKKGNSDACPWEGMAVPVLITAEYPEFLCGTVLPHRNPRGFGPSKEYPITISKHDVRIGEMILTKGGQKI